MSTFVTVYNYPDPGSGAVGSGPTAPDGSYSIAVPTGTYVVGEGIGFYSRHGWSTTDQEPVVVTGAGDVTGIDMAVPPFGDLIVGLINSGCDANTEVDVYDMYSGFFSSLTTAGQATMNVPAGTYLVGYFDPTGTCASGWYGASGFVASAADAAPVTVTLGTAGSATVQLPYAHYITGSTAAGAPGGMLLEAFAEGAFYVAVLTSDIGKFSIPVASGTYTVWVAGMTGTPAGGWYHAGTTTPDVNQATPITVAASDVAIKITLHDGGEIDGVVNGPGGVHEGGLEVDAMLGGDVVAFAVTQSNGRYALVVPAGTFTVFEGGSDTLLSGWYSSGGFAEVLSSATGVKVTVGHIATANIAIPVGHFIGGDVTGQGVLGLHDVAVELFKNAQLYVIEFSGYGGEFDILASPGTYQLGFADPYDIYAAGWYSDGGYVELGADSTLLVLSSTDVTGKDVELPLITVPDAPSGATAAGFDHGAIVQWAASAADGFSPIISYTATASPGGATCSTDSALFCNVTGLSNGTPYTFTVVATNEKGDSGPSNTAGPVTPTDVPAPPTAASAVALDSAADVVWDASTAGGVTGYTVTSAPGGLQCMTTGALRCKVSGLTNGTPYTFTVDTTDGNGTGPESGPTDPVTPQSGLRLAATRLDSVTYGDLSGYANDRYGTDAAVVEQAFGGTASTVYIADGLNFPDALGAGAAAAKEGAPVLLVNPTSIPAAIAHELSVLQPTTIYIAGGTASVSTAIQTALGA
ncbi:MAG TPA: cell wall-binding repeat-containing protein, partial [Acidimicrobiales bacterium]|nr:cell wall-binding repeat-containing protein [Acidimicrobiales bacterium]